MAAYALDAGAMVKAAARFASGRSGELLVAGSAMCNKQKRLAWLWAEQGMGSLVQAQVRGILDTTGGAARRASPNYSFKPTPLRGAA